MKLPNEQFQMECPIPKSEYPFITMAHGSGGKLMHQLISKIFITAFGDMGIQAEHDGAVLDQLDGKLVMTTDSYVVNPIFFPGGNIGTLAVYGTVNDLAMCGARPMYISAGFILEEGLPITTLWEVALSMRHAAEAANIKIVTGDTKVVDKGKGDGIYINTAGVGELKQGIQIAPSNVEPGDAIIISGDIGRHSIAVLTQREGLSFDTVIESDCAPLSNVVMALINSEIEIHCLRDLTRGGLASALVEIANTANANITIDEDSIPVIEDVSTACEILGFDPLYLANEGRFIAFIPERFVDRAMGLMLSTNNGITPAIIGRVGDKGNGWVTLKTSFGVERIIDMLSGDQFPRIC